MKFPVIADEQDFARWFQDGIWLNAAENICQRHLRHLITYRFLRRTESGEHIVFLVDDRQNIPDKVWEEIPSDGSINHDHYLYGAKKRK